MKQAEKKEQETEQGITVKKADDFSEWFTQLTQKAELSDLRYNVKGFVVYLPWSVSSIKKMYTAFEKALEEKGHEPLIMPSVIPEKNFKIESEHVKGFTPEVFWITEHGSNEKIEEKLALRPTSETAFYQMYALWIRSYNNLPFKRYQSCQVWRYEGKATRPFIRGREFYWIEAHDAFANLEDAKKQVEEDMETTKEVMLNQFAIPFIFFQRPEWYKFPGAVSTYAADALMPSGRVIQLPSTHLLGDKFSKAFNIKFVDKDSSEKYAYITCYGPAITRIYGAMISIHGDDKGLILPFELAPKQIAIVPIFKAENKEVVLKKCEEIKKKLKKYEVSIDGRIGLTPGFKFNYWELKGVPVRIEIGQKDIDKKTLVVFRRDINEKTAIKEADLLSHVAKIEAEFTSNLKKKAEEATKNNIVNAKDLTEVKKALDSEKIARVNFCSLSKEGLQCAEKIEKELQASVRGKRLDENEEASGNCIICNKKAAAITYIAKSY